MNTPIYFGVFEDGLPQAKPEVFAATLADLEAHAMNAICFTNSMPDLSVSDKTSIRVVSAPLQPLYKGWYPITPART